jgi:putative transposase
MAASSRRQFSAEKGIYHMRENTITQLPDPSGFSSDPGLKRLQLSEPM